MMIGRCAAVMQRGVMRDQPGLRRLVVIGRHDQRRSRRPPSRRGGSGGCLRRCCSTPRPRSPAPGPRRRPPLPRSPVWCSSWLSVGLSPVVPTGTSPWLPSAMCQSTSFFSVSRSSSPFLNGVTRAGMDPLIMTLLLCMGRDCPVANAPVLAASGPAKPSLAALTQSWVVAVAAVRQIPRHDRHDTSVPRRSSAGALPCMPAPRWPIPTQAMRTALERRRRQDWDGALAVAPCGRRARRDRMAAPAGGRRAAGRV